MNVKETAWGFTKEDLKKYGVQLQIKVNFKWNDDTPEELRKNLSEAACVLHQIAEKQVMLQLQFDNLSPTNHRDQLIAEDKEGYPVVLRDSGWSPL